MSSVQTSCCAGSSLEARTWTWQHAERSTPAVSELHLEIPAGKKILLTGPSGAGKSTLLHGLAGVLNADGSYETGELRVDGVDPRQARGTVGLVQQSPEAQVVLSRIGDDAAFAAENLGVPRAEIWRRVQEALDAVGLGQLPLDHPTAALSGGQKQRLALAGLLTMRPRALLLDEPTSQLDPEGVEQVREAVLSAVEQTGATLVVVEHREEIWRDVVDETIELPSAGSTPAPSATALKANSPDVSPLLAAGSSGPSTHSGSSSSSYGGTSELLLQVRDCSVARRPAPAAAALVDAELSLHAGEALAITGPNGAGKSTLLMSMAGLLPLRAGRVQAGDVEGSGALEEPHQWTPAALASRIGIVFQEPEHQFLTSTVSAELAHGGASEQRVHQLLQRLRLTDLAEANPFTLSGGEQRRLSIGIAMSRGARVLLLDEPTVGQDDQTFADLVWLLAEHLDSGGAVCAVTHDRRLITALGAEEYDVGPLVPAAAEADEGSAALDSCSSPALPGTRSDSWLGRRAPLAKLISLLLLTAALVPTIDWVSSVTVVLAAVLVVPLAGFSYRRMLRRTWPFLLGAVVAVWGTAIAGEESGAVLLNLGFTTISEGSLQLGLAMGLRSLAFVLPAVLLLSTTDPTDLSDSLAQQLRLPARFVLGALAGMRLMGLLAEQWRTIGYARRSRGVGGGSEKRTSPITRASTSLRAFLSQSFGLLVQALRIATQLAVTMEARGFGAGPRTWARPAKCTGTDIVLMTSAALIAAAAVGLAMATDTWNLVWG